MKWPFNLFNRVGRTVNAVEAPAAAAPIAADDGVQLKIEGLQGFEATIERKEGVMLTYQVLPEGAEGPHQAASAPFYYEISVSPTGENPEYPVQDAPSVFQFTHSLTHSSGFNGGVSYVPKDTPYTGFSLVEEFDDGKIKPGFMGRKMPAHHSVMLRAHFKAGDGFKGSQGLSNWVRKSERESDAWKAASQSHVFYI